MTQVQFDPTAAEWTKELPAMSGWYWWLEKPENEPEILRLYATDSGVIVDQGDLTPYVDELSGYWLGPLSIPAPPKLHFVLEVHDLKVRLNRS